MLVWRFGQTGHRRFFGNGFSVGDNWIGLDDWDLGVVFFQIFQADFQVQFTGTSNNLFSGVGEGNLDHWIGFGESFETFDEFWKLGWILWSDGDLDDWGDGESHNFHVMGLVVGGDGTSFDEVLIDSDETDDVTGWDGFNSFDMRQSVEKIKKNSKIFKKSNFNTFVDSVSVLLSVSTHHKYGSLDVFDIQIFFFAWFEVGTHNSGFHTGGDLTREDSSEGVESTFIRCRYHFTDVHHQWSGWIARFDTNGAWIVHWSLIQKFASVLLGSDWRWQVNGNHLQQSFTGWEPVSHDGLHESFFYKTIFFGGEEVFASEPIVHDFLFHGGPFLFFVVFGGGEGGEDWVEDELDEGSFETDILVFVVLENGFTVGTFLFWSLLPFLSVGIKVVITPEFGHEFGDVFDSEFSGIKKR